MKKSLSVASTLVLGLALLVGAGPVSCKKGREKPRVSMEQGWYRYISAHTSGVVPRRSSIRVLFVNDAGRPDQAAPGVVEFSPSVPGRAQWRGTRELVFTPDGELKPDTEYKAVVHVDKILKLPREFATFSFSFRTIKPAMEVRLEGLTAEDADRPEAQVLKGMVITSDMEEPALVEKVINAEAQGRKLEITWSHSADKISHYFTVSGIERSDVVTRVRLSWDGAPLKVSDRGYREVEVPPLGLFELVDVEAVLDETRFIRVRFSDPLLPNQDLEGLIRSEDRPLTFEVEGNVVNVYSRRDFTGEVPITISAGVKNYLNRTLSRDESRQVVFGLLRPQVRFVGRGVILPRKDSLRVPFEAVGLKAVQVTVFQVYSGNIAQFLQVNELEGSSELTRVGRYLWRKTVPLSEDPSVINRWSRYDLDVSSLFQESPGSIFRIILSFNRGDSVFSCPETAQPVRTEPPPVNQEEEVGYWDATFNYPYLEHGWWKRNDPCDDAYYNPNYNREAVVGRNFIASNVGLLAKLEENNTLHVVATDIGTAAPLPGARVRALNYQNQLLGETASDGNGFAVLKLDGRPFLVTVQSGDETGYLRLNSDSALSLSQFDVGGEAVKKGIKGAVYGERGVWRPGDTLYLTFVLFDRERNLPPDHPVVMEIYSPRGRLVETRKPDRVLGSFYAFRVPTAEDVETGAWQARVLVGGLTFSKTVRIETVVPNRLKVDFKTGRDVLTAFDVPLEANISSQWLHGAPASNLKFDVSVRLASKPTTFKDFPDYEFQDPTRGFEGGEVALGQGVLDKDGRGRVKLDFAPARPSPGMLDATFVTRVFEESGDFSLDSFTQPYHPYDCYVGVRVPAGDAPFGMLVTDKEHAVDIVTVDPSGRGLSRRNLKVSLYKIEWRWWWERESESLAEFISRPQTRPISSAEVSTEQGRGSWRFRVAYPGWGRFLVRVEDPEGGHAAGKIIYVDWPGWAGRSRATGPEAAARLNFTSDKAAYQVGEKAVIYIPESVQGRALVSVENGSSVLQKMWVSTRPGENRFEIPVTEKMTPNVYVHVSLIQPHRGKVSDVPVRMYGVIPIMVEDQATVLEPVLKTPDEIKPGERFKVQVGEKKGRAMTYTVAVVDEGLLGLTRFKTPDLRREFYRREALGVTTWDLFDRIVEAYGAELTRILALGGGEAAAAQEAARKPRRFPPVVMFDGPFEIRPGETASHEFLMPQYFGAVRVMVVGGRERAFGSAEKSVLVRKDLMALSTLPRVVRPGEDIAMPITVFVTNPALKQVEASVETNELFRVAGETAKTVPFSEPGDRLVTFSLKTAQAVGQGRVRFRVLSGAESVEDTVWIPVVGSNPMITRSERFEVKPGQTLKHRVTPFGIESTNTVTVEASTLPPLNLEKRLDFLVQYPYGCLEQTLSTAFPQLYLLSLVRLDERQRKEVEEHIKAAVGRLGRFQMSNGAFAYWPGGRQEHEWTSVYAGWFLLEASRLGYSVPEHMLASWKANQKMMANSWTTGGRAQEQTQAFRLFALASAREPDLGAMNRLRERQRLDPAAALQLAAAFNMLGMREAAAELARRTELKTEPYRDLSVTFGSEVRDKALMVRCLVLMDMRDRAEPMVQEMVGTVASDYWLSTNETAFALMAIAAYYGTAGINPFTYSLAWDEEHPATVKSGAPVDKKVFPDFPVSGRTLVLTNQADIPLNVTIYTKGVPPAGEEGEAASEVELKVVFRDMARNPIDITSIRQGTDFMADVRVRNTGPRELKNVVLAQLFAAGFQVKNPLFAAGLERPVGYDYQDVRDDRVLTFFGLRPGEEKTFLVVLNASYLGRFYQPGAAVEVMYDASAHANSKGNWVSIVQ